MRVKEPIPVETERGEEVITEPPGRGKIVRSESKRIIVPVKDKYHDPVEFKQRLAKRKSR